MIKPYKGIYPKIHSTAFYDDSSQIIGDVTVGEDSSIWFNAVLRGDVHYIRIGRRTNIQDGSIVHVTHEKYPAVLGDEVTIAHGVILHGCHIKSRSLVGMGATVMDNAVVCEECIVAAGSVVVENTVIEPGWLAVGIPAKPKRRLRKGEFAWLTRSAENYVDYKNIYLRGKA